MKNTLRLTALLLVLVMAFSCGEKEPTPVDPPQQEQPDDPQNPSQPEDPNNPEDPGQSDEPEVRPDEVELMEISTAEDLVKLASWVNAGTKVKTAILKNDIDMSSVEEWTPIGNAVCPAGVTEPSITGNAWTGTFDGNGFTLKNFKMVAKEKEAGRNYGMFGVLAPGSLVQNFKFDASCSFEVTATASIATGIVAGYVFDATVRDVTNNAPMTFKGKAGQSHMSMAMIGQVYSSENGVTVDSCHNNGEIKAEDTDNLKNNAHAYHIAGVVGVGHASSLSTKMNTISDCSNNGNITSATGRSAGIIAVMQTNTQLVNCENTGDHINTMATDGASRPGGITCYTTASCKMSGCINRGKMISTTSGRCGGLVSLCTTAVFENCANYGEVLTDGQYRGLFWAYNTEAATFKSCIASGKVGTYNNGSPVYDEYTEARKASYLGVLKSGISHTLENITYQIGMKEPEPGQTVDAELSILLIGNSFTMDSVDHLPGMLKAAGLNKIHMVLMYYGGRIISEYYNGWTSSSDYKRYECLPGAETWTQTTASANLAEEAASKKWDIVTIQEHTGTKYAWIWDNAAKTNIQGLVNHVKNARSDDDPKFYYILSQAYHDSGRIRSDSKSSITWTDHSGMWEVIAAFGKNVIDNLTFDGVISTGVMLENLRTSSLNNHLNLSRDGYHMDYGIGRYGASCTVFETLITPKYNVTLDMNTYRFSTENTTEGSYSTPVTNDNAPIALLAARNAIKSPYVVTDMSKVTVVVPENSIGGVDYKEGNKE